MAQAEEPGLSTDWTMGPPALAKCPSNAILQNECVITRVEIYTLASWLGAAMTLISTMALFQI